MGEQDKARQGQPVPQGQPTGPDRLQGEQERSEQERRQAEADQGGQQEPPNTEAGQFNQVAEQNRLGEEASKRAQEAEKAQKEGQQGQQ
jgi:hypothetical protein